MGPGQDALPSMYTVNIELAPAMMGMDPAVGTASTLCCTVVPASVDYSW